MTKDRSILKSVIFIVVLALLILFLSGQCIIVALYGPSGIKARLGLNGYPDYICTVLASNSQAPVLVDADKSSADNLTSLSVYIQNEVSMRLYDNHNDILAMFTTGTLQFKPVGSIHGRASLSGGYLAALLKWGMDNNSYIVDYVGTSPFTDNSKYDVETVSINRKGVSADITMTISLTKTDLLSLVVDSGANAFLDSYIKMDKVYFTLHFILEVADGSVVGVQNLVTSYNDSSVGVSSKISSYISSNTGSLFSVVAGSVASVVDTLGNITVGETSIIVEN